MGGRGDQVRVGKVDEEGKIEWAAVGKRGNECTRREDGRLELNQPARMMVAMLDSSNTKRHAAGRGQPICGVKRAVVEESLQGYAGALKLLTANKNRVTSAICVLVFPPSDVPGHSFRLLQTLAVVPTV